MLDRELDADCTRYIDSFPRENEVVSPSSWQIEIKRETVTNASFKLVKAFTYSF